MKNIWKNLPSWLKGGIIAGLFGLLIAEIWGLFLTALGCGYTSAHCTLWGNIKSFNPLSVQFLHTYIVFTFFVVGSIVGLIVRKIK